MAVGFRPFSKAIHQIQILGAVTKRSLLVDFRYKFQLVVEATWTAINVAVFVLLGAAWQETASTLRTPYTMITFFIIGTGYFTVFSGIAETTVTAITEENQLGTMGFLITNSVSPIAIIVGRYLSATVRWILILIIIVIPPMAIKGVLPSSFAILWSSILIFFIAWVFFLGFTLLLTSIALIFKKTITLNRAVLYIVRFAAGAFVPINSFDASFSLFGKPISHYLIWFPPAYALESIRWLFTVNSIENINCSDCGFSKDNVPYSTFNSIFGVGTTDFSLQDPMVQNMLLIVFIFLGFSLILVERLTTISRKWGTIEFY